MQKVNSERRGGWARRARPHQDLEVQAQVGEQRLLKRGQLAQQRLALLRRAHHEQLHLAELVQAVQAAPGRACAARARQAAVYSLSAWLPAPAATEADRAMVRCSDRRAAAQGGQARAAAVASTPGEATAAISGSRRQPGPAKSRAAHGWAGAPAAPASVRKQWPKAARRSGSSASASTQSMATAASGTSAVPVRHSGESRTEYTCAAQAGRHACRARRAGHAAPRSADPPGLCHS